MLCCLFFECDGDPRGLHVLTHSFPTRRSSDLSGGVAAGERRKSPSPSPGAKRPLPLSPSAGLARKGNPASSPSLCKKKKRKEKKKRTERNGRSDRKSTRLNSSH